MIITSFKKINIVTYFENLIIGLHVLYDLKHISNLGMAMGRGGAEGWDLRPRPAWIFLAPSPPRPA